MAASIGRIVHYVTPKGQHRPAIVTDVADTAPGVSMQIFQVPSVDLGPALLNLDSVIEGTGPGTWHWPEKVS